MGFDEKAYGKIKSSSYEIRLKWRRKRKSYRIYRRLFIKSSSRSTFNHRDKNCERQKEAKPPAAKKMSWVSIVISYLNKHSRCLIECICVYIYTKPTKTMGTCKRYLFRNYRGRGGGIQITYIIYILYILHDRYIHSLHICFNDICLKA